MTDKSTLTTTALTFDNAQGSTAITASVAGLSVSGEELNVTIGAPLSAATLNVEGDLNVTGANVLFYHRLAGSLPPSGLLFTVGL